MTPFALYLTLLFAGILSLVAGLYLTRMTWRRDIEPFRRRNYKPFDVWLRPERYARAERLGQIRFFNLLGAILVAGAILVMAQELRATLAAGRPANSLLNSASMSISTWSAISPFSRSTPPDERPIVPTVENLTT
jgi:hypothetical protein